MEQQISSNDIEGFKILVHEWLSIDDKIKQLKEAEKKLNEDKKKLNAIKGLKPSKIELVDEESTNKLDEVKSKKRNRIINKIKYKEDEDN